MGNVLFVINLAFIPLAAWKMIANGPNRPRAIAWAAVLLASLVVMALVSLPLVMAR